MKEVLLSFCQVLDWTACWSRRSDIICRSAWVRSPKLWSHALRLRRQPFRQTAGGGCATVLWGIVHPHCMTLGRALTDKWPEVINILSHWFWGMWGTISTSGTTRCTAGDFGDTYSAWMWHKSTRENNFTWAFWIWQRSLNQLFSCWATNAYRHCRARVCATFDLYRNC